MIKVKIIVEEDNARLVAKKLEASSISLIRTRIKPGIVHFTGGLDHRLKVSLLHACHELLDFLPMYVIIDYDSEPFGKHVTLKLLSR